MRSMRTPEIIQRRQALLRFIKIRGLKVKTWCERAGVKPTSVYNFLNGHSNSLEEETYEKLATAEGVPSLLLKIDTPLSRIAYAIRVKGVVQAGVWAEAMEWERQQQYDIAVNIPQKYIKKAFGLLIEGPSMNLVYPEGSIVICVSILDLHRDLKHNDKVIVQRVRRDGLIEATVKELQIDEFGEAWLWPRSSDPRFQQPISVKNPDGEAVRVEILAIVIGAYKPEPNIS